MLLYLIATCERLRVDDSTFFRLAHVWGFGTDPDLTGDVQLFRERGFIPYYVQKYLQHIKESTS